VGPIDWSVNFRYPQRTGHARRFLKERSYGAIIAGMQAALVTLVIVVVVVASVVALYTVATSGHAYREIGKGGMDAPVATEGAAPTAPPDDRDEEIRELLQARNALRERRGEPALDVAAELAELTGVVASAELRDELRALVEARNRRRERAGLAPLQVEAEIERRLRDLN
jgi:hypothetical protein